MAMNKKEQAAYDELVAQARINRALRWSDCKMASESIAVWHSNRS